MTRLLIPFRWPPPLTRQEAAPPPALRTKVGSSPSNNASFENNNTMKFTSDKTTSIDKNTTTTFNYPTNKLPPSVEANCQKLYQKYGHPVKTYRKWKKSSSQSPIYTPETTTGHFFWSGCDDDPPESLAFYLAALQHRSMTPPLCTSYGINIHL